MHPCAGDTIFLGYWLTTSGSQPEPYESSYQLGNAWFNEERFQEGLKEWQEGKRKSCPVTFHEFAYKVVISTCTTTTLTHKSLEKYVPKGYRYPQDYQGMADNDRCIKPSKKRCEAAVRQFRQLQAEGLKSATLETGWFSPGKIVVVTLDGAKHKIPL